MRILVSRAREDAERTAQKLAARGHEALLAPVIDIVPTGEPMPAGRFDALVVTSVHGVEALSPFADKRMPVFAVGERTADAARALGFPSVSAGEGDAKSLSALIQNTLRPGLTLLHVTGRHHKDEPASSLRAAGFSLLSWAAYEAKAARSLPEPAIEALRTGKIGAALHYSRRSADLFARLAEGAGLTSALRVFPHLCLSTDVAVPLEAVGVPTLIAEQPSEDALLRLLDGLP